MWVLGYLRYTWEYGLHYTRYLTVLEGYSDANWISDKKDSKSTNGYVFLPSEGNHVLEIFQENVYIEINDGI